MDELAERLTMLASDSDVAWCVAPALLSFVGGEHRSAPSRGARVRGAVAAYRRFPLMEQAGEVLTVTTTVNQRRATGPVLAALGHDAPRARRSGGRRSQGIRHYARAEREAAAVARALAPAAMQADTALSPAVVLDRCLVAARSLVRTRAALRERTPAAVLVASQHDTVTRGLLLEARRAAVPAAYIAHAPFARVPWYEDLPVDLAMLRGEAEVACYRGCGADPSLLVAVGNPAAPEPEQSWSPVPAAFSGIPVVATSPHRPDRVRRLLGAARDVAESHWWVALHPRQRAVDHADLLTAPLQVWTGGRTYDLLRQTEAPVVQDSSGVAWEALSLGLPVVQFNTAAGPQPYPLLDSALVVRADGEGGLAEAVEQARSTVHDATARFHRRALAAQWCRRTGASAAAAAADALRRLATEGSTAGPAYDRWRAR